jgi:adenylate cyclase
LPTSDPPSSPLLAPAHWSERRWVRALRGGRGRPLGLVVLGLALAGLAGADAWPLSLIRLAAFDAYQSLFPRVRISAPAVIVEIDETSLRRYGQWPWPRTLLARLVSTIGAGGPAAIGIDILMPERDRLSPSALPDLVPGLDRDLSERLRGLPSNEAVLAAALRDQPAVLGVAGVGGAADPARVSGRLPPVRIAGPDPVPFVRHFAGLLRSVDEIDGAAAGHGLISVDLDAGVVRRMPLIAAVGETLVPAFGLEMLRVAAAMPALAVRAGHGVEAVGVGDLHVPTERDGSVWVHYTRSDATRFVSAADVLSGVIAADRFERKLVLVGVTAIGLSDYQPTPVSDRMPGVEIHAQLLEGIFDGDLLSRPGSIPWVEAAVLLASGVALILLVPRLGVRGSTVLALALVAALLALGLILYLRFRILFDGASPALGLAVLFTAMLGATLAEADSQRRVLRRQVEQQREAALRVAGELEAARRIQMGILPDPAVALAGEGRVGVYASLEPAREVGGDLYDVFPLDGERVFFLIGDVSGKGLPGSLFMAVSKSLCKSIALRRAVDVGGMMRDANAEISRDNAEGMFVTVWAGILDARTGELEYCNAGHDAPYLLARAGGLVTRIAKGGGPPLCVVDDFPYESVFHRLSPGDVLCLLTDGVTEAVDAAGRFYGRERLEALLARLPPGTGPRQAGEAIRLDVRRFADGVDPADDVAILALEWTGVSAR